MVIGSFFKFSMKKIDQFLNGITMYRLVLYSLFGLAAVAIVFGFLQIISYAGGVLLVSLVILMVVCIVANFLFAKIFRAPTNVESSLITALILFFIFPPPMLENTLLFDFEMLALAGVVAIAGKYFLALRGRHLFNPAALAAVVMGFSGLFASWWIGSKMLFPFVLVVAFLIVRKIRREALFFATVFSAMVFAVGLGIFYHLQPLQILGQFFLSGPILFFAAVMVTEPITSPPTKKTQIIYGILIGALYSLPYHFGPVYSTPEMALLVGNLFAYAVSLRRRLQLSLIAQREIATDTYEFEFAVAPALQFKLNFKPGQYLEWTLPHKKPDTRGRRRYFTIASSPTEKILRLGVKIGVPCSSFKKALRALAPGDKIFAGQLGGDFVLPADKKRKLVFMAGGIGVTPFCSMIQYLMDTDEKRDVILFCSNRTEADIPYRELFDEAVKKIDLRPIYITGRFIDAAVVAKNVPDFAERMFYLSGPSAMVDAYKVMLKKLGVRRKNIVTDYFPGFV